MDPCFYKIVLRYVASVCKFGADLTCFSASDRSLAGRVLVAVRCLGCKLACSLHLFPLPLAWCVRKTSETCTLVLRPAGVGSKAGAEAPSLGRFKGKGFLREGGNRNRVPQKRCFCGSPVIKKAPGGVNPPFAEIFAAQKCS